MWTLDWPRRTRWIAELERRTREGVGNDAIALGVPLGSVEQVDDEVEDMRREAYGQSARTRNQRA